MLMSFFRFHMGLRNSMSLITKINTDESINAASAIGAIIVLYSNYIRSPCQTDSVAPMLFKLDLINGKRA